MADTSSLNTVEVLTEVVDFLNLSTTIDNMDIFSFEHISQFTIFILSFSISYVTLTTVHLLICLFTLLVPSPPLNSKAYCRFCALPSSY